MKTLDEIAIECGTDRSSVGIHNYMTTYDGWFSPFRDQPVRILEVGIHYGAGINTWANYFTHPQAEIIGVDNHDWGPTILPDPRIKICWGSQDDAAFMATLPPDFDIIIDDGGHFVTSQRTCMELMWPRVKPGGWYVVEDLWTAWSPIHCNDGASTIATYIESIFRDIHEHVGWAGQGREKLDDKWWAIEYAIVRKGIVAFKKRGL